MPTYNSENTLPVYLSSIQKQTYPNIEIIIVDNLSKDNTVKIATEFNARIITCKSNMSKARNIGALNARGKYFWFMDSDMELPQRIVEKCVETIEQRNIDALIIPEKSKGNSIWAKCRALDKLAYLDDEHKLACRFMRCDVFEKLNGFDERLIAGEDYDFHLRLKQSNFKYAMVEDFIYHYEISSITRFLKKYFNYGKTMPFYVKKHPVAFIKQFFIFRKTYVRNYSIFWNNPSYVPYLILFKIVQYLVSLLGVICYYLKKSLVS